MDSKGNGNRELLCHLKLLLLIQPPEEDSDEAGESTGDNGEMSVEVKALCVPQKKKTQAVSHPPISGSVEERCEQALRHVAEVSSTF